MKLQIPLQIPLQTKPLDFEALLNDLPKSNPLIFVNEVSHIYDEHFKSIKPQYENNVKGGEEL